ncbi:MAG: TIGR00725 family protein [Pseudonocardiales bacterium]
MVAGPLRVAVVGPGAEATPEICALARDVGRLLAERGAIVLTGGLGGVMAAAAEGATSAGGVAVGLLPGTDRAAANQYLTISVPTGLGELRNALLVECADGIVAVGGSWGTLSEIALACRAAVPVVSLAGWSVLAADGSPLPLVAAASPDTAVRSVLDLVATRPGSQPGRMDG